MNEKTNVLYLLKLLALGGCALSENLSPPPNGKSVNISVVKPVDVDILPMDLIHLSDKFRDAISISMGAISSRTGYHLLTVPSNSEKGIDRVSNSIALD